MGSPAADRRRAGAPQQSSLSMAGSSPSPATPLRATHVAPAGPVRGRGRGSGARSRRVPVERSDAGMVEGEEESSDDGGVVVEDEVGGDGPVVVEEEEANDDGPVAEEDENVGGVAEQDQEASVGRAGEQDPDDNDRVARRRRPWGSTREPAPPARGPPRAPLAPVPSFPAWRAGAALPACPSSPRWILPPPLETRNFACAMHVLCAMQTNIWVSHFTFRYWSQS